MSGFKDDLYAYLGSISALSSLVGDRIYPNWVTDARQPRPYIVFTVASNENVDHLRDPSALVRQMVQFDIWGDVADDTWAVQTQLRKALDGYYGTMNSNTAVREARLQNILENVDGPNDGGEEPYHRLTMDVIFWYRRDTQGFN